MSPVQTSYRCSESSKEGLYLLLEPSVPVPSRLMLNDFYICSILWLLYVYFLSLTVIISVTFSTKSYTIAFDLLLLWTLLPSNFKETFWLENNTNLVGVRRTELKCLQWFSDCVFLGRISAPVPMQKSCFPNFMGENSQ